MDLNNDLITEILLHLPVQSLLRFRNVCKCWCNIIDSSRFTKSHLHYQSQNNSGEALYLQFRRCGRLRLNRDNGKMHKDFPAFQELINNNFWREFYYVSSPVNGLICIYSKAVYSQPEPTIGIYNPCLDKIKILPLSPTFLSVDSEDWIRYIGSREIGFGLDEGTKEYKLVQLMSFHEGRTYVEVYSGITNTWRKLITHFNLDDYYLCKYDFRGIKSKTGSWAHWQTTRRANYIEYVILSFNMQDEVFETIPYPDLNMEVIDLASCRVFAKDDDSLALFVYTYNRCSLEVWELNSRDNERCWTHVKDIVNVMSLTQGKKYSPMPIALWKRDVVVLKDCGYVQCNSIFYNYYTEKVIKRCEIPNYCMEAFEYMGSLILP